MDTSNLINWIAEREAIRLRRVAGDPPPWTDDLILREWSFCNVFRDFDRTTEWIFENWCFPHAHDPDLWFAMAVARYVNWPDSLAEIGYPAPWKIEKFGQVMEQRLMRGEIAFGPAYKIMPTGQTGSKVVSVAKLLDGLWRMRDRLRPRPGQSLAAYHAQLKTGRGLADFMAAQIIADLKHYQLHDAKDWFTLRREWSWQ